MSKGKELLFTLSDGTPVFKDDILYHPDRRKVGWYCVAYFKPEGDMVTVRAPNGAVPHVLVSELRKEPPLPQQLRQCGACGQALPYR